MTEKLLKEIAERYADELGAELIKERAALAAAEKRKKLRNAVMILAPVAASVIIALFVFNPASPPPGNAISFVPANIAPVHEAEAEPSAANSEPAAEAEPSAAGSEPAPAAESAAEPESAAESEQSAAVISEPSPLQAEIIPLSANLPEGYVINEIDYDHSKTVYSIENEKKNPLVLTVEQTETEPQKVFAVENYTFIDVNGSEGFLAVERDFKMLIVQSKGLRYIFSSEFDAEDLYEFAKQII